MSISMPNTYLCICLFMHYPHLTESFPGASSCGAGSRSPSSALTTSHQSGPDSRRRYPPLRAPPPAPGRLPSPTDAAPAPTPESASALTASQWRPAPRETSATPPPVARVSLRGMVTVGLQYPGHGSTGAPVSTSCITLTKALESGRFTVVMSPAGRVHRYMYHPW